MMRCMKGKFFSILSAFAVEHTNYPRYLQNICVQKIRRKICKRTKLIQEIQEGKLSTHPIKRFFFPYSSSIISGKLRRKFFAGEISAYFSTLKKVFEIPKEFNRIFPLIYVSLDSVFP